MRGNINLSNFTFANTSHNLINDEMKQTVLFFYETLCIREGIFEFCHDRNFLSRSSQVAPMAEGTERGRRAALGTGRYLEGQKYGILKFGRF